MPESASRYDGHWSCDTRTGNAIPKKGCQRGPGMFTLVSLRLETAIWLEAQGLLCLTDPISSALFGLIQCSISIFEYQGVSSVCPGSCGNSGAESDIHILGGPSAI